MSIPSHIKRRPAMSQLMDRNCDVGLIGVGLVGLALAKRLTAAGYRVTGYDPNTQRMSELANAGGGPAISLSNLCENQRRIILSLPDGDIVAKVLEEIKPFLAAGTILIDTTTAAPEQVLGVYREMFEMKVGYMDATISGSSAQVENGDATWLVGAEDHDFNAVSDLFQALGGPVFHLGPTSSGTRMKLVSNLILGLNRAVLAEGLALAEDWQMNLSQTLEVLKSTAAYSRVMDTKGRKMIEHDYIPQARLRQHHKDIRLILESANQSGPHLVLSRLHDELLQQAETAGLGDLDNAAIFELWRRNKGMPK